ncbi:hypothetical protein [Sporosarcina ureilytica]|uniref:Uncharacterized protein n=1 Tax=Sporosarcina ureilytica TaxID=298596 RepID=A0A1D8JCJ9_9BACL|nr:hypothetical protein [Sporosarcina ureilytica]AOV06429.1 hypothetical protein BI350_01605 [Sporosarcina ureilytica]
MKATRWKGLLKKEWVLMKSGILIYTLITMIVVLAGPTFVHYLFGVPINFFENTMVIAGLWLVFGTLMNCGIIFSSLGKEMKQPHIWLHSPVSMLEFVTVKAVFSTLVTICLTAWCQILIVVQFFFSDATLAVTYFDAFLTLVSVLIAIVLNSIFIMSIAFFFWSVYQVCRSRIGGIAILVAIGFFFVASYVWEKFRVAGLFHAVREIGPIKLTKTTFYNESTSYFFTGIVPEGVITSVGSLVFYGFITLALLWLGTLLFEKKVRL